MWTALIVILIIVAGALALAATKPASFVIQRSALIQASPEKIYPAIADFHQWAQWSPWEKLDPAMLRTYDGATNGKGAIYAWNSAGKAGAGRMEITDAVPSAKIGIQLDFSKPFTAHNQVAFTLQPQGNATLVNWAMSGPNLFIGKIMSLFMDMDKIVGKDFEAGLASLKQLAEKQGGSNLDRPL